MRLNLDILQRAGDALATVGSFDRRRVALIGGLNVAAVALAFGALHLGGTIVEGARSQPPLVLQPSPEATVQTAAKVSAPIPHPAPARLAAVPDAVTLFSAPIIEPAVFASTLPTTSGTDAFSTATTASARQPAAPTPAGHGRDHAPATPPVLASLAPGTVHATDIAAAAAAGPLVLTDALLDADQGVGISAISNTSVAGMAAAGLGTSVSATANAATGVASATASAAAGVAASVSSAASGVAGAVGSATGAR